MPDLKKTNSPDITRRHLLLHGSAALATASVLPSLTFAVEGASSERADIIQKLQEETGLDRAYIEQAINAAVFDETIIKRIKTPYESKSYAEYRPLFVHQSLADKGTAYLTEHRQIFEQARKKYGVQPEIIAAILGMETRYGHYKGKDRVLDALFTLATGYPRRANFFRNELGQFLLLCKEEKRLPTEINGSYAGAFGTTQFIPSSYRGYAVDADGDGHRDVWNSPEDIINSVAHYFHRYGWDDQRPVAHWLERTPQKVFFARMLRDETKKWRTLAEVRKHAPLKLPDVWQDDDQVAMIQRVTSKGKRTALVHRNFYVITRWNRSYNYAMAITELAHMLDCPLCKVEP